MLEGLDNVEKKQDNERDKRYISTSFHGRVSHYEITHWGSGKPDKIQDHPFRVIAAQLPY